MAAKKLKPVKVKTRFADKLLLLTVIIAIFTWSTLPVKTMLEQVYLKDIEFIVTNVFLALIMWFLATMFREFFLPMDDANSENKKTDKISQSKIGNYMASKMVRIYEFMTVRMVNYYPDAKEKDILVYAFLLTSIIGSVVLLVLFIAFLLQPLPYPMIGFVLILGVMFYFLKILARWKSFEQTYRFFIQKIGTENILLGFSIATGILGIGTTILISLMKTSYMFTIIPVTFDVLALVFGITEMKGFEVLRFFSHSLKMLKYILPQLVFVVLIATLAESATYNIIIDFFNADVAPRTGSVIISSMWIIFGTLSGILGKKNMEDDSLLRLIMVDVIIFLVLITPAPTALGIIQ